MTQQEADTESMPAIIVSKIDHRRLMGLAAAAESRAPEVASVLQSEMERAQVVADDEMPDTVVRMGSTVEYRSDSGQRRRVTLVFPSDADIAVGRISILTPIGAALIGLSPGQSIAWTARDGQRHKLTVLTVEAPDGEVTENPDSASSVVVLHDRQKKRVSDISKDPDGDDPGPQAA